MDKIIRDIILEFHRSALPPLIQREIELPELPPHLRKAVVFIGMRRVGKTYLIYQHMQQQLRLGCTREKLLYINFEDDRLLQFKSEHFQMILDVYFQLYPQSIDAQDLHFYFDEIQNISGWEMFIRRLLDKEKMTLFITGSSAKLLSKEIATSLRGRCIENEVFPLNLHEYLACRGIQRFSSENIPTSKDRAIIRHHCEHYLKKGGFPETLDVSDALHSQIIQSYVNSAVFRDVVDRHQIKNSHIVKVFLIYCLQNIASPLSITKVYNTLKSLGEELTRSHLYEYLDYFEDAYLICTVPIFDFSARKRQVNPSKIYCMDCGIISSYSIKPHTELSACLENAVYIQLRQNGVENVFYHKTESGKEVDFVAQHVNGKIELYQVCIDMDDAKTKQREISALIEAAMELKIDEAFILTTNTTETLQLDSIRIHILPYWQWALGIQS